jgi:membrane protein
VSGERRLARRHHRRGYRFREFLRRLAEKCDDDEIYFMAGAIAFNLVLALFPLLVLVVGLAGYVLPRFGDPAGAIMDLVTQNIPQGGATDLSGLADIVAEGLVERRASLTIAGSAFLLWVATRLSASLRVSVREIFDIGSKRNPIHGKLFDGGAVIVGTLLLTLNIGATVVMGAAVGLGVSLFGLADATISFTEWALGLALSVVSIWVLMLLAYRYMPVRPIPWRTAMVAATFTAFGHESLKSAFSWYATEVANYGSTFGNLATVLVLFFWIYYECLVFILGGEIAQVSMMRRASRVGVVSFDNQA